MPPGRRGRPDPLQPRKDLLRAQLIPSSSRALPPDPFRPPKVVERGPLLAQVRVVYFRETPATRPCALVTRSKLVFFFIFIRSDETD